MKIAITSVCSDGYVLFFEHFIKSILKHNPDFDKDFYVFYDGRLRQENIDYLRGLYSGFVFKNVDFGYYESNYKGSIKYYSIESFSIKGYDRVVFFDGDLLCMKPLDDFWKVVEGVDTISMVKEIRRGNDIPFNAGNIIIGDKYLNDETYTELIRANYSNHPSHLNDQKLYNLFFEGKIQNLEMKYNTLISELDGINYNDVSILHYIFKPNSDGSRKRINKECLDAWDYYNNEGDMYSGFIG